MSQGGTKDGQHGLLYSTASSLYIHVSIYIKLLDRTCYNYAFASGNIGRGANKGSSRTRENGPERTEKKDSKKVVKAIKEIFSRLSILLLAKRRF